MKNICVPLDVLSLLILIKPPAINVPPVSSENVVTPTNKFPELSILASSLSPLPLNIKPPLPAVCNSVCVDVAFKINLVLLAALPFN